MIRLLDICVRSFRKVDGYILFRINFFEFFGAIKFTKCFIRSFLPSFRFFLQQNQNKWNVIVSIVSHIKSHTIHNRSQYWQKYFLETLLYIVLWGSSVKLFWPNNGKNEISFCIIKATCEFRHITEINGNKHLVNNVCFSVSIWWIQHVSGHFASLQQFLQMLLCFNVSRKWSTRCGKRRKK